ncbi:MAG: peptidoglycan DD-metalloendopeptidase family protein [Anaerolineales bacterium]|nr:peptidoglycan DD-metalloendopeptidase family protein [Anaerolineales bacterium]
MKLENRVWNLGNVFVLILVLLSARIVYWPLVRGNDLLPTVVSLTAAQRYLDMIHREQEETQQAVDVLTGDSAFGKLPQPVIQRTIDLMAHITRGTILDRNGRVLAYDFQPTEGDRERIYNEPSLAHVLGYVSGLRIGLVGLEATYNESLLGLDRLDSQLNEITHQELFGSDLILTIDSNVQRKAEQALGNKPGGIVVLDAKTGAVLAMVSNPGFDPNRVLEPGYIQGLEDACGGAAECSGNFINRAAQALYPPGSTFKTLTLLAALDTGQVTPETVFDFGDLIQGPNGNYYVYSVDGGIIPDPNHAENKLNLAMSYAKSANAAFARIGDEMPPNIFMDYAARFFFSVLPEKVPSFEIGYTAPQLANDLNVFANNNLLQASTGIGQGELLTNPMSMAMIALAVMNDGNLPLPYFVQEIRDPDGQVIQTQPFNQTIPNLMSPQTARTVKEMMETVVAQGSGKNAAVAGLMVGGKTGTAQVGGDRLPHAWFLGFAESEERSVVIAVMVENAGEGHTVAAPLFAQIADVAVNHLGEPVTEIVDAPTDSGEASGATTPTLPPPDILHDTSKLDIVDGPGTCQGGYDIPPGLGSFLWPVDPPFRKLVGDDFIPRHPGIDLGTPPGSAVYASDEGVVVFANWSAVGYGNVVVLDHGNGFRTLYAHLSQIATSCGAFLQPGDLLGLSGSTGNSSGPHLHYEIRVPEGFLNPWTWLPPP